MHTIISIYKNNKDLDLTTCELEILHRIAFDYTIEEDGRGDHSWIDTGSFLRLVQREHAS